MLINIKSYFLKLKYILVLLFVGLYISALSQSSIGITNILKIGKLSGVPNIASGGGFGFDTDTLGDLNGDGTMDYVIGSPYSYVGSANSGIIHILFMNPNNTVQSTKMISRNSGNLNVPTGPSTDVIGCTVCNIGDFNHDGTNDLAIGMQNNNQVSLLMINSNGTVNTTYNLSTSYSGYFGSDIINLGDVDNDGVTDIMVCGYHDGIYLIKLNANGTIKTSTQIVNSISLGYTGTSADNFPANIREIGDLDGDGINEFVASAHAYNNKKGEVVILYFDSNYNLKMYKKISSGSPNFVSLNDGDKFGSEIQNAGDLNNDGIIDIFVGATGDDYGGPNSNNYGAVYGICLNNQGGVKSYFKIDKGNCNFGKFLNIDDAFGIAVSVLGDINNDNKIDYMMGAYKDDEGGSDNGAIYIFSLGNTGTNSATIDTSFCTGEHLTLQVDSLFSSYLWNTGDTGSSIVVNTPGIFVCKLTDSGGCVFTDTINVNKLDSPEKHNLISIELCAGSSYNYKLKSGFSYLWWDGLTSQNHLLNDSGLYWVSIYNKCDSVIDSMQVINKDCNCNFTIPNVFTPNGDGLNDNFYPVINCDLTTYHIYIYNRWGKLLFQSNNQFEVWDGKYEGEKVPDGVYFYLLKYGYNYPKENEGVKTGSVTIFR